MPSPLTSAYPPPFRQHVVSGKISDEDFRFLEGLFGPVCSNLFDAITSNLYAGLIQHLRNTAGLSYPADAAWSIDHPSIITLRNYLDAVRLGRPAGDSPQPTSGSQHDPGATGGIREDLCEPPSERLSVEESRGDSEGTKNPPRKGSKRQRPASSGTSNEAAKNLDAFLRRLK